MFRRTQMNGDLLTIDLFAGAGGITEGFRQAGYQSIFANDFNPSACATFSLNHPDTEVKAGPIEELDPAVIRRGLSLCKGELHVLVGGPPCQGFSINAPERFLHDPRNSLFRHYLRFVDEFAPRLVMMENVPGMLSLGGGVIFDRILAELTSRGYHTSVKILLAAHYGVPQVRWRTIILGARAAPAPSHPEPGNFHVCRPNFKAGGALTYRQVPLDSLRLARAVTLGDAIRDLPPLNPGEGRDESEYTTSPCSDYGKSMRRGSRKLYNHSCNALSQVNLERLRHIPQGGSWTDIPFELLPAGMKKARRGDHTMRYGRLGWNSLAGTMMTKCDPHWGAVFHPDQERTFSVREAARIQSFPDRYRFTGAKVSQYEQVGNAVPVLLARAVAAELQRHPLLGKNTKTACH